MGTLNVYFKDGRVFSYDVDTSVKAREHMAKIWAGGYRHCDGTLVEWFGPHYLDKLKYVGDDATTNYPDKVQGT